MRCASADLSRSTSAGDVVAAAEPRRRDDELVLLLLLLFLLLLLLLLLLLAVSIDAFNAKRKLIVEFVALFFFS